MSEAMDSIDVTKKGAALAAAEAGRFDALPIYKPEIECAPARTSAPSSWRS